MWFHGPEFLWKTEIHSLDTYQEIDVPQDDCEIKKVQTFKTETDENCELQFSDSFKGFSSWTRLKRVIALCKRFTENLKLRVKKRRDLSGKVEPLKLRGTIVPPLLTVEELQKAEHHIVKIVQYEAFKSDIYRLRTIKTPENATAINESNLKRNYSIYRLDPFLDLKGILRVGGRMKRAQLDMNAKHRIILPKKCHISNLVTRYCNEKVQHQGRGMTVNEVRASGFWIIGLSSAVSQSH